MKLVDLEGMTAHQGKVSWHILSSAHPCLHSNYFSVRKSWRNLGLGSNHLLMACPSYHTLFLPSSSFNPMIPILQQSFLHLDTNLFLYKRLWNDIITQICLNVVLAHVLQNGSNTKLSAPLRRHHLLEPVASPHTASFHFLREIRFLTICNWEE